MKHFAFVAATAVFLGGCVETTTTASSANRIVKIGNTTGVTMTRFFASNTSRSSWEEDILGANVLSSGRSVNVDIDDGTDSCLYDLKAVFADGDVVVQNDFNVCTQSTWTVG
ncbi:MAG: hypothetical protein V3U96_09265 [Paracoccaceae bacterium]